MAVMGLMARELVAVTICECQGIVEVMGGDWVCADAVC